MAPVLLRCTLIAVALVAGAWLAVGLRVVTLEEKGEKAVESAQSLTADPAPELIEGRLSVASGRRGEAVAFAIRVIAEEPENVDAWYLAHVSSEDPKGLALTRRRVRELNPLLGDQLK